MLHIYVQATAIHQKLSWAWRMEECLGWVFYCFSPLFLHVYIFYPLHLLRSRVSVLNNWDLQQVQKPAAICFLLWCSLIIYLGSITAVLINFHVSLYSFWALTNQHAVIVVPNGRNYLQELAMLLKLQWVNSSTCSLSMTIYTGHGMQHKICV